LELKKTNEVSGQGALERLSPAGSPTARKNKVYCDKWVHEGVCAFTQQGCRYKHEMPLDKATQHSLGLFHGLPGWWKKRQQYQEAMAQRQRDAQADAELKAAAAAAAVDVAAVQRHHMKQMSAYEGSRAALSPPQEVKLPIRYVTHSPRPTYTWNGEQRQQRQQSQFQAVGAEQGIRRGECMHMSSISRENEQGKESDHS
jgi:hypothetical protein